MASSWRGASISHWLGLREEEERDLKAVFGAVAINTKQDRTRWDPRHETIKHDKELTKPYLAFRRELIMERLQQALPHKFGSFSLSSGGHDGKPFDRSLSLGHVKLGKNSAKGRDRNDNDVIQEEEEIEEDEDDEEIQNLKKEEDQVEVKEEEEEAATATESKDAKEPDVSFASISADIDEFIGILLSVVNDGQDEPPAICESTVEKFLDLVDKTVTKHETGEFGLSTEHGGISLFEAIDRVAKLMSVAENFVSETKYKQAVNRAGGILHRAMCFLEEEFYALLDDPKLKQDPGSTRPKVKVRAPSFGLIHELTDRCQLPPQPPPASETKLTVKLKKYPPEAVEMLRRIASGMISGGYATECCQVFTIARRNAFDVGLSNLGYEKLSIDDVVKMSWESLEGEIATWIKVFRQSFLGRFAQHLDPGRQTEKYIKFGPEELENYIDELFSGNPSSMVGRKRT
ncbi:hypothetical protein Cni_G24311 [Canna indica]|uniref:Exocyst subunit Exo70 family protein n=1 Tax=Canna indica TaxID=4628 RepID=A0AAQ3KVX9_9LILI|nr:hypothetical protein Cni_G24311 [Canna indica]